MKLLNRTAVMVVPGEPFLEWVRKIDAEKSEFTLEDLRQDPDIYLIADSDDEQGMLKNLGEASEWIFGQQLYSWCTDESRWPEVRDTDTFLEWFEFSVHSMVFDTAGTALTGEHL